MIYFDNALRSYYKVRKSKESGKFYRAYVATNEQIMNDRVPSDKDKQEILKLYFKPKPLAL